MPEANAKAALFDAFASVAAALASGRRAEIVDLLAQGERPVEEIARETGQSVLSDLAPSAAACQERPRPLSSRRATDLLPTRKRPRWRAVGRCS